MSALVPILKLLLWLRLHGLVHRIVCFFGKRVGSISGDYSRFAWEFNEALIQDYGYDRCPVCQWVDSKSNKHINREDSWCREQYVLRHESIN